MITITQKDEFGRFVDNTGAPIAKTGNVLFHEDEEKLIIFFSITEPQNWLAENVQETSED
jgi:hypothetical protein